MEKSKNRYGITIVVLLIFILVLGLCCTIAHHNNVIKEKDAQIKLLKQQAFDSQKKVEKLLGGVKDLKDSVFKVYLTWRRTRKVELNAPNFHKYYVGIEMAPFFRLNERIEKLIKAYNEVYYPDY